MFYVLIAYDIDMSCKRLSFRLDNYALCAGHYMMMRVFREGLTALHWAARYNHVACIEALIRMKADVNIRNKCGIGFLCSEVVN